MKQKSLQLRIGIFLIIAAILLVGSLFFFGVTTVFQNNVRFVSFFPESVRGLDSGSIVRYRGVRVGEVKSVRISLGEGINLPGIPVIYEIDIRHLRDKLGVNIDARDMQAVYPALIEAGLTAKLENESLVTGQLFINLNLRPEHKSEPRILQEDLHWVPTAPSLLANFTDKAIEITDQFSQIDFGALSHNLNEVLIHLNRNLEELDTTELSRNLNLTLETIQSTIKDVDMAERSRQLGKLADEMSEFLQFLQNEGKDLVPEFKTTLTQMNDALNEMTVTLQIARNALESRDGPVAEVEQTLRDLQTTLQSVRSFVDFIRRNPNALLFGTEPSR